jgi:hypothetical protein
VPEQIATATMEGTSKRGRPCKRWRDELEENLNMIGIKHMQGIVKDGRE